MSNKKITDLTELTTPTTDDVFPIVDITTNTTQKVQVGNLPIQTAVTTALATKQDTLVSGTNIKTLNSTSLLGSGNIVLTANPSGVAGAIQFSNGSAFASDATNLFWDDTNNRLGVGTNAPTALVHIAGNWQSPSLVRQWFKLTETSTGNTFGIVPSQVGLSNTGYTFQINEANEIVGRVGQTLFGTLLTGGEMTARVGIRGNGTTSATTSLLVQNSAGTTALSVRDDSSTTVFGQLFLGNNLNNSARINGDNSALRMYAFGAAGVAKQSMAMYNDVVQFLSTTQLAFSSSTTDPVTTLDVGMARYGAGVMRISNGSTGVGNLFLGGTTGYDASAKLQIDSTTQGVLFPRMTTTQKNAIATPSSGLVVYDTTTNKLCCYNGSTWNDLF